MPLNPLLRLGYKVIDMMIVSLEHLPHGLTFWYSLPEKGKASRHTLRRRWAVQLIETFFPLSFLHALVRASLNDDGIPDKRGSAVYHWLLKHVYRGDTTALYTQWKALVNYESKRQKR